MVMQCILRKLSNLPITLIELNTMLHVVCAIVMYFFCKPPSASPPIQR